MENLNAKKSLGQNFLKSKEVLNKILLAGNVSASDFVLEVGPGKGALTEALLSTGASVVAIEKDSRLIEFLNEKFKSEIASQKLTLIEGDALDKNLLEETAEGKKYKVVANIPYYITGKFLRTIFELDNQPIGITLLLQKEVVKRIVAGDKKESILSISVKIFGEPKYIMTVQKKYFSPIPKVDSAVLQISNISKDKLSGLSEEKFFQVLKNGFAHKRKMLLGNLKDVFPNTNIMDAFKKCNLSEKSRAEDITTEDWICLTKNL